MSVEVGQPAPDFTMPTNGGGSVSLSALKGKPVVLYFYPKDDTSGCTTQACGFRDALLGFGPDTTVIGVSKDSVASHDKFQKKYDLTFPLASDAETGVAEAYGVWQQKSMYGRTYMGIDRSTFLIDRDGKVAKIWRKVKVPGHVAEVEAALKAL